MIDLVPAERWMASAIVTQPSQSAFGGEYPEEAIATAMRAGLALACMKEGKVLAIGGVARVWDDRGAVWGLLSSGIHATMIPIHRIVRRGLEQSTLKRIEVQVAVEQVEGHRWMAMLGFELEAPLMREYWNGRDFALYARIRR